MIDRLIIDFDHTLFDSNALKRELVRVFGAVGVPEKEFWATYREARNPRENAVGYSPERHIAAIASLLPAVPRAKLYTAVEELVSRTKEFLFPDALDFLTRMVALAVPTVIYSRGDRSFQMSKITACGVDRIVSDIHVTTAPKAVGGLKALIRETDKLVYLINDLIDETVDVCVNFPSVTPILIRRPEIPLSVYANLRMLNFGTLTEVKDYLTVVHATNPQYADS